MGFVWRFLFYFNVFVWLFVKTIRFLLVFWGWVVWWFGWVRGKGWRCEGVSFFFLKGALKGFLWFIGFFLWLY